MDTCMLPIHHHGPKVYRAVSVPFSVPAALQPAQMSNLRRESAHLVQVRSDARATSGHDLDAPLAEWNVHGIPLHNSCFRVRSLAVDSPPRTLHIGRVCRRDPETGLTSQNFPKSNCMAKLLRKSISLGVGN